MSNKAQSSRYFETDAAQVNKERQLAKSTNKWGNPIALKGKIVAAIADPHSNSCIYAAEATGNVRKVDLGTDTVKDVYSGAKAPLTSVAVGGPNNKTLFAGSWDKLIYRWDVETGEPREPFAGHYDFVKALVHTTIGKRSILISGGADKRILVWDTENQKLLHTLQDASQTMLAIQSLAVDPFDSNEDEIFLVSASSDPQIRRWKIRLDGWEKILEDRVDSAGHDQYTILEHDTTVYKLLFHDDECEADLYTASGDGTAKCLKRLTNFKAHETYKHGGHVRAVAITDEWLITAGRDEDIKIWDRFYHKLYATLQGHFDEVTDLVVFPGTACSQVCSVSLDGTVRSWSLWKSNIDALQKEQQEEAEGKGKEEEAATGQTAMTADEEEELSALMEEI